MTGEVRYRQLPLKVGLSDLASFENFHPGANREAVAAMRDLSTERPGILYLHGASGTGKSHLLYAAVKRAAAAGRPAVYLSRAAASGTADWLDLGGEGLLCIDDLDGDFAAAEGRALFSLYERVCAGSGSLALSSRLPPARIDWALPDLRSRVQSDLVYRLAPFTEVELEQALRLRAGNRGIDLTDDVVRFVLHRYERSPSALFHLLDRIDAESLARKRRVTIPFLRALEAESESLEKEDPD